MGTHLRSQLEARLKAVEPNITGVDKVEACQELNISRPTLDKYLNGEAPNVDTALEILEFFDPRVSKRMERLKKVS